VEVHLSGVLGPNSQVVRKTVAGRSVWVGAEEESTGNVGELQVTSKFLSLIAGSL
jgi:hypothetical protein